LDDGMQGDKLILARCPTQEKECASMREECIGYLSTIAMLIMVIPGSFLVPIIVVSFVAGRWTKYRQRRKPACQP
ncbi:MAG: hypothetical protein Q8R16_05535, partial [bacterium]|nr:hypothetical protein [bacterium]